MNVSQKTLAYNTFMLYILRFSTYFFSFITVPYQTRILGATVYGKLSLATALMVYFQLLLDFGFILSATEDVAIFKTNISKLREIYSCVTLLKLIFSLLSFLMLLPILFFIPMFKGDFILYNVFLIGTIFNGFLPDFLYRGMEDMGRITYRTIFVKTFFTLLIFIFLKTPEDYMSVPILLGLGNGIALLWTIYDIKKRYDITICKVSLIDCKRYFKRSGAFFLSRIASTVYTATNTLILGVIDPIGNTVGYYSAAYKLISTGQSALSPISDSLYPYMVVHKDFKLIRKILLVTTPIILLLSLIIYVFASPLCIFLFGRDFADTAPILRAMLPIAVLTLPDYILGFPTLSALNKSQHANISIYISSGIHLLNLILFWHYKQLNVFNLAYLTSIAFAIEVIYRGIIAYRNIAAERKKQY